MIVCDTSILSEFFRRKPDAANPVSAEVRKLIELKTVVLPGVVRQELLSGIKYEDQYRSLELKTRALPILLAEDADHLTASKFYNLCRANGVQGSAIDFLICAMAVRRNYKVFSVDPDFDNYAPFIPIERHEIARI